MAMRRHPQIGLRVARASGALAVCLFGLVARAGTPGRLGTATGAMRTQASLGGRGFMGRGMVVPPSVRDALLFEPQYDTDDDGRADVWDTDNDNDVFDDWGELALGTDPNRQDTDEDQMLDGWEVEYQLSPLSLADAHEDADGDGLSNLQEFEADSNPRAYVLELSTGWNLLSIARVPKDYTVDAMLGGQVCGPVWSCPEDGYIRAQHVTPLAGHWAYCRDAQRGSIDIGAMEFPADADSDGDGFSDSQELANGTEADRYVLRLRAGWNLISICRKPTDNSPNAIFGRGTLLGPMWQWAGDHYERAVSLEPLLGYWVHAAADVEVDVVLP